MIYAIACVDQAVKFGRTDGQTVDDRLRGLQVGNHTTLTVLATCEVDDEYERIIHFYLAKNRLVGEWFLPCADVSAIVDAMRRGTQELETLLRLEAYAFREIEASRKQRWDRASYNGYQFNLMRQRRAAESEREDAEPSPWGGILQRFLASDRA